VTKDVQRIRHDIRNIKMIVDNQQELIRSLEVKYGNLNAKIYTTVSVAVVFIGAIGFFVNVYISVR